MNKGSNLFLPLPRVIVSATCLTQVNTSWTFQSDLTVARQTHESASTREHELKILPFSSSSPSLSRSPFVEIVEWVAGASYSSVTPLLLLRYSVTYNSLPTTVWVCTFANGPLSPLLLRSHSHFSSSFCDTDPSIGAGFKRIAMNYTECSSVLSHIMRSINGFVHSSEHWIH